MNRSRNASNRNNRPIKSGSSNSNSSSNDNIGSRSTSSGSTELCSTSAVSAATTATTAAIPTSNRKPARCMTFNKTFLYCAAYALAVIYIATFMYADMNHLAKVKNSSSNNHNNNLAAAVTREEFAQLRAEMKNLRILVATNSQNVEKQDKDSDNDQEDSSRKSQRKNNPNDANDGSKKGGLPSCKGIMNADPSFRDGAFLTRHTTSVKWVPRHDGSRELRHSLCHLHRYTAKEARQCFEGKHFSFIGDSLTRYMYMTLMWFLHKGSFPPHFGRSKECQHFDQHGQPTCSQWEDPNPAFQYEWSNYQNIIADDWISYVKAMGNGVFDGYMESSSIKQPKNHADMKTENYFYASPPGDFYRDHSRGDNNLQKERTEHKKQQKPFIATYFAEQGHPNPLPMHGFNFIGCAYHGNCSYSYQLMEQRIQRHNNRDYDFNQTLEVFLRPDGYIQKNVPHVDVVIYNRGLWGLFTEARAKVVMPLLKQLTGNGTGECYFRSTTGRLDVLRDLERGPVKKVVYESGCGFLDFGHLVEDFNAIDYLPLRKIPTQKRGRVEEERDSIFQDLVHFSPWVYEELNNVLLNVLCNVQS